MLQSVFEISQTDQSLWETCQLVMQPTSNQYPIQQRLIDHPEHLFRRVDDLTRGFRELTLLHLAGSNTVTNMLIYLGLDVNERDRDGNTPLHFAALRSNWEVVQCLLSQGAKPNLCNHKNERPLHWAATYRIALYLSNDSESQTAKSKAVTKWWDLPLDEACRLKSNPYLHHQLHSLGVDVDKQIKRMKQWLVR